MEQNGENKASAGAGQYINLSMRLFLTGLGASAIRDKRNIERSTDAGGNEVPALAAARVLAGTLKDHIIASRINQIQLLHSNLVVGKSEITDLTKLIVYSMLYRLYPENLLALLAKRGVTFPYVDARSEQNWATSNPREYHALKLDVFNRARDIIIRERTSAEENPFFRKKSAASVAVKFLNMAPIRVYRTLLASKEGPTRDAIIESILSLLDQYLNRTHISDWLAAAFLEWVERLEKINLDRIFSLWRKDYEDRMKRSCPIKSIEQALAEGSEYHDSVAKFAGLHGAALDINWKFGGSRQNLKPSDEGSDNLLRIRIVSKGLIGDWVRTNIQAQLNTQAPPGTEEKSAAILKHTRALKAECLRYGIEIFMQTQESKERDETVLSLSMRINPIL